MTLSKEKLSGHYINGQWVTGSGKSFHSINPANGNIIWQGSTATKSEIDLAYESAKNALSSWSNLHYLKRADFLNQFALNIGNRKQALTYLIALETGKPLWEALTEVNSVISKINLSIKAYEERCKFTQTSTPEATQALRFKPHGVFAVLGPFNFPTHLSNGHRVPALLAGNSILYQPSDLTPASAELVMQCWHETGIPSGVIQCLQGDAESAKYILQCDIQGVLFTGSYQTGVQINQQFAQRPEVILALEMGGNNSLIIDKITHVDIKAAVYNTILSSYITSGQRCSCARRVFIPNDSIGDQFLLELMATSQQLNIGPFAKTPEPFMGPVIRHTHALNHLAQQESLIKLGGESILKMRLLEPNTGFLSPGMIDMTTVDNPPDEEIFAPLIQIYRYADFESAIHLANQTRYGLAAGLFSNNIDHYQYFFDNIKAGLINWNRPTTGASSALPFGGIGKSGNHRPSAYFAADYCAYPIASMENTKLMMPEKTLPGVVIYAE